MYHHQHSNNIYQNLPRAPSVFGSWPPASEHPLFYISIYAAIGLASALASVLSVTAQYTGALRASRILFKYTLVFFICDTLPTPFFHFLSGNSSSRLFELRSDSMIQHLKVRWMLLPLINLHSLRLPRSYAEPLWKGCRDDRLFFSRFTASSQYLACRFLCRYHHRRVSFFPNEYHRFVDICKQCCFPVLPYPCHFHRVCIPPVGHRLSQHRP